MNCEQQPIKPTTAFTCLWICFTWLCSMLYHLCTIVCCMLNRVTITLCAQANSLWFRHGLDTRSETKTNTDMMNVGLGTVYISYSVSSIWNNLQMDQKLWNIITLVNLRLENSVKIQLFIITCFMVPPGLDWVFARMEILITMIKQKQTWLSV